MKYNVSAVLYPQETGGYTILSPELPGCVSQGSTMDEAISNLREAATLYLEDVKAREHDDNPLEGLDRPGRVYAEVEVEA